MNNVLIKAKQSNGRCYRAVRVIDIVANDNYENNVLSYDELEFVKLQMKIDLILFSIWIDIKCFKVTETNTLIQQTAKASNILNKLLE